MRTFYAGMATSMGRPALVLTALLLVYSTPALGLLEANATAQATQLPMDAVPSVSQRSGAACAFPFEHGGETYRSCMAWEDGYSWCPDAYGWWGICEEQGPVSGARSLLSPGAPTILIASFFSISPGKFYLICFR